MVILAVPRADENEFVQLGHKHNFSRSCFGVLLGMLHNNLEGSVHIGRMQSSMMHGCDMWVLGC